MEYPDYRVGDPVAGIPDTRNIWATPAYYVLTAPLRGEGMVDVDYESAAPTPIGGGAMATMRVNSLS